MAASPMEQFNVYTVMDLPPVFGLDLSVTNATVFMVLNLVLLVGVFALTTSRVRLIPDRRQVIAETIYEMIAGMVRTNAGKKGMPYFPFVFSLFVFLLISNVTGMIPGWFTVTSHIAVTFALAAFIFIGVTIIGFVQHGLGYLRMFMPHGAPWWTGFILIPVEIVSYLSRPISLSVRLFANMTVGHVLLKVIAGFAVVMGVLGIFPVAFLLALTVLELFVAVLQAYIFAILTCIYLHDALSLH
ncbi:MAG: F0F1 ATP synthase subunit A [Pseudomonadota bacterium]